MIGARRRRGGFTLLEVMIALAILSFWLVMLIRTTAGNLARVQENQMIGVGADLARDKMYEIEELLHEEGFQQLEKEEGGNFADQGWPEIEWRAKIEKIELPNLAALTQLGEGGEEDPEGDGGGILGGMFGMAGGMMGGSAGAALIGSQFEMFRQVMEESIRKVTLTISSSRFSEPLVFNLFFTDPAAVNRVIMGGGGAAAGEGGGGEGGGQGGGQGGAGRGGDRGGGGAPGGGAGRGGGGPTIR
jgi:prepilin-type N-terminal cleavage/methylation domain-containing protein